MKTSFNKVKKQIVGKKLPSTLFLVAMVMKGICHYED